MESKNQITDPAMANIVTKLTKPIKNGVLFPPPSHINFHYAPPLVPSKCAIGAELRLASWVNKKPDGWRARQLKASCSSPWDCAMFWPLARPG